MALFPCVRVYNFFGRTTGRILMSDSLFERKCPGDETFTIVDIDFFSKINIDRFSIDQCIDFRQILEYRHVAYHSGSVLGPEHEYFWQYFCRKSISIDRYIDFHDFRSICVNFSSLGMLHISMDQFWALKTNSALFFRKSISIDQYMDFGSINVSIFDKLSSLRMLHIILDPFWALNTNPAVFFFENRYLYI